MKQEGIQTWDLLQANLSQQVETYQRLDHLLALENQVLIKHRVEELIAITPQKEQLNRDLQQLRDDYSYMVKKIVVGERPSSVTVEELISLAPLAMRERLSRHRGELLLVAKRIQQKNNVNQGLLDQSMRYVFYMMKKMIEISAKPQAVYCHRGYPQILGEKQTMMSVVA